MEEVTGLQPDIVCLPELFDTMWVDEKKPLSEVAEDEKFPGPVTLGAVFPLAVVTAHPLPPPVWL